MDHQQLLEKYHSSALTFIEEGRKISAAAVNASKDGEWSAAFVIHHIADAEIQFGVRYSNALCEDNPAIVPFDEEKFPIGLQYGKRSVTNSLNALAATHELNYEILKNASAADWDKSIKIFSLSLLVFSILASDSNCCTRRVARVELSAICSKERCNSSGLFSL